MWPPSSGSSGMKLNMPMKKLKPAISISRKTAFSLTGNCSAETVSPAIRPPPTMLTDERLGAAPHRLRQGAEGDHRVRGHPTHLLDRVERAAGHQTSEGRAHA